jgi:Tfp pilus assembly protein PilF
VNAQVRRNDPCPCGSGRRYKECHGKLEAGAPSVDSLVQAAMRLHQQGHVEEATRLYREILAQAPGNAFATHYLGLAAWHGGDVAQAERLMRASLEAERGVPDFHNNLGLLLRDTGRPDEAIERFRHALAADPRWVAAYNNLALTLEAQGRWDEALDAYRHAIAAEPRFAAAHQNLARTLLLLGRYAEGWQAYRWRLAAQGLATQPPDSAQPRLAEGLAGRSMVLVAEQGIGDVLFFLRFAPELARRGARVGFQGDERLYPLLERTGVFALGFGAAAGASERHFVGDLPWLLQANEPSRFPPPLGLTALQDRLARARAQLESFGPAPRVALTWRAGTVAPGPVRVQSKHVAADAMAARLRGRPATWVSLQRRPGAGEREALERALQAPVHDASRANEDLEDVLAWLALVDDYVGVSNANTHLRAGLGKPLEVLVPFPPEWRWGIEGGTSPWFPTAKVTRQAPGGDWP